MVPDTKARFEKLASGAQLDILVPRTSDFDLSTLFRNGLPERLSSAPSRRNLYFDEKTHVVLVLRTSVAIQSARELLANLEVILGAHATDAVPQGHGNAASASGKHDLSSSTISGSDVSDAISVGEQTYVVWKTVLHIFRPRVRLQRPAVYFTASLTVTSGHRDADREGTKEFLKSFEPLPANVLEPLLFDPALSASKVYLPEDRITKVLPASADTKQDLRPIRGATKRAFPVVPALYTRIRYSALPDAIIASLHLETSQLVSEHVRINDVEAEVAGADVDRLTPVGTGAESLPGDESIVLYKFRPKTQDGGARLSTVSVKIRASASTEQGSRVDIETSWQAQVDLSKTVAAPTYRWSRPLSGGTFQPPARQSMQSGSRPQSADLTQRPVAGNQGINFNFETRRTVTKGEVFEVAVHCLNRSGRTRHFALVVAQAKQPSHHTSLLKPGMEEADLIANIFHAPPLERPKPPDVLDLNPDVRIGPLPAGAAYEARMSFRAITTGVLDMGHVRIIDLNTKQTIDIRDLPDVIALEESNGST